MTDVTIYECEPVDNILGRKERTLTKNLKISPTT